MGNVTTDEITRVCKYICNQAHAMATQSGEPALELAGAMVSTCAVDPIFTGAFAKKGTGAIIDRAGQGLDSMRNGCLSYRTSDGRILTPKQARELSGEIPS